MKKMIALVLCAFLVLPSLSALAATRDFGMIRITEVMASNGETLDDSYGKSCDWIELKNMSDDDSDMSGLNLSDGKKILAEFTSPEGVVLPKGG